MKFISRSEARVHKNSDYCIATEYPLGDEDLDFATVQISGRYPDQGRVMNVVSKEACFILKGGGLIVVEGKEVLLDEGDLVLVTAGEKYFWEGTITIAVTCRPPWSSEQHKRVE